MTDRQMAVLKNTGMKIAIDDFGVGQSNLERLTNVDADIVKLDKQFVAEDAPNVVWRYCDTQRI